MHPTTSAERPHLSLPDELYLLGHDDDTGQPHIHTTTLAIGLAGAVLIDLYLAGEVTITSGTAMCPPQGQHITLATARRHGPTTVTARALYGATVTPALKPWLRGFALKLHDDTRDRLVAAGILRRATRRRLGGLLRADTYLPTHYKWPVIARARVRYLAVDQQRPDDHSAALAGLVTALRLERHLYVSLDDREVRACLHAIAAGHYRPVRDILAAVDATIGDLATATYG
jgi:hypothetical protein